MQPEMSTALYFERIVRGPSAGFDSIPRIFFDVRNRFKSLQVDSTNETNVQNRLESF